MTLPAAKELGETENPKELIVGDPSSVTTLATLLSDEQTRIDGFAGDLRDISIEGWSGGIGEPAYATNRSTELDKWKAYGDLLKAASSAVSTYAGALTTAQTSAQTAIDTWKAGEAATKKAVEDYNTSVTAYNDYIENQQQVCVPSIGPSSSIPSVGPAKPGPFVDPGQAKREEAQKILDDARTALEEAAATAMRDLGGLPGAKTEGESGTFNADGSASGPKIDWDGFSKSFGTPEASDAAGEGRRMPDPAPWKITLGEVDGQIDVWGAKGSVEDYWGDVKVGADGEIHVLEAHGNAGLTVDSNGLNAHAGAGVNVVSVKGSAHAEYGYAEVKASGEGYIGADAQGTLTAGPNGVHASGEAFAGGKISGELSGDVGGVGGTVGAEGWAGAGVAADADIGYHDGEITVDFGVGAALGLGGKVHGGFTIDIPKVIDTGGDIIHDIGSWLG